MRNNRLTKFMGLFLVLALCLTLAACGNSPATEDAAAPESVPEETAPNAEGGFVGPPGDGPASRRWSVSTAFTRWNTARKSGLAVEPISW